ncbi:MAG: sugar nucleotide-binding protein [Clostridia bacterium]|nr:sugar nucleotide-binding protein [Clostridia bacterium]
MITIVNNISTIINSGALVKHFGLKKDFEAVNVFGTENVVKFCVKYGKRLMHISTVSVSGNGSKEESIVETSENVNDKKLFTERDLYIGQNLKNVYANTKFRGELAVLEAIYNGLDAQILRLGNITNRYSDGAFQMNAEDNAFAKRLKTFIEIGAFPDYTLAHELELTPVDLSAAATIKLLNHKSDCNMFHIMEPKLLPISVLIDTLSAMDINILPVSNQMMTDIITGILSDEGRKDLVSGIIHDLDKEKRLVYTSSIRLKCLFTENYLKNCRFSLEKN